MRTVELMLDQGANGNYFVREAFNTLRANILFSGKDVKVIVVTSCFAHEGKTSVSFDLCVNLAEAGKRVLLLDADLRKSVMVSRYTKERGVYGLSQVLSGQVSAKEAVYATNVPNMHVMFAGPIRPTPPSLWEARRLRSCWKRSGAITIISSWMHLRLEWSLTPPLWQACATVR